jgi:hypothetical protein
MEVRHATAGAVREIGETEFHQLDGRCRVACRVALRQVMKSTVVKQTVALPQSDCGGVAV